MRPIQLPGKQKRIQDRAFFRAGKPAGPRLVFLPFVVMKLRRLGARNARLEAELAAGRAASRHPFWREIAARPVGLARLGFANRRFRRVELEDFDAVAGIVEARLAAARDYPRQSMLLEIVRRPLFARLDPQLRAGLGAALAAHEVPLTSSHGDLHFFNFVRAADGYRLIDWDHYDRDGSFLFDYLDFHLTIYKINDALSWPTTLARIDPFHPAILRSAETFGIDPESLFAYYLVLKVDMIVRHHGGWGKASPRQVERFMACIAAAVARIARSDHPLPATGSV